ncbi:MAG TPA: phenylalanine--tRNA ligase subunit beta [Isosphaeraceae bacterium]|jgi:phenylalanyl-tRNA synthetase beta chain|nr:phenylalanine--tRNA ligase subunit beta [Isosphaeraceae bacterium]
MIVSWNWLTSYLRLDMPADVLAERLALAGLNHERTEEVGGDLALDLEVTSNRPDCLSHLGVAREIAVLFDRPRPDAHDPRPPESGPPARELTRIDVEAPDLCPRFTARVVSGVTVGPSPWWLRKRLETIGVRPISNVVDITNYVMFECGQPLHAYDLARLDGRRLVVRRARGGETLTAINNKVYELSPEMLVIADASRPVGLAGVMGGLDTEIGPATRDVLIEAAQFDPVSVRRTGRALGLSSPSSHRFERGLDPSRTEWASRRCAELILDLAGGTLHEGVIDLGEPVAPRGPIVLRFKQVPRVLGIDVPHVTAVAILKALGLDVLAEGIDELTVRPPSWRADLEREVDLIEEVARIYGYDHIPEDRPVPLARSSRGPRERVEDLTRVALTGLGFDEAVTFSLVADDHVIPLGGGPIATPIRVEHSSRKREVVLRPSLVPSLLAARSYNEAHGVSDARLFEVAHVYLPRPDRPLPDEPTHLGIVGAGDYPALKGVVEALLDRLHVAEPIEARPSELALFAPGRQAEMLLGGASLGHLGEVDRAALDRFELRGACVAAELDFDLLNSRAVLTPRYHPLPAFPAVSRDLSLVVPDDLPWADLAAAARGAAGPQLEEITYLDTFRGGNVPAGSQSVHFGLRFRHPSRTLTGEEVERALDAVVADCAARFGATLRA